MNTTVTSVFLQYKIVPILCIHYEVDTVIILTKMLQICQQQRHVKQSEQTCHPPFWSQINHLLINCIQGPIQLHQPYTEKGLPFMLHESCACLTKQVSYIGSAGSLVLVFA